MAGAYCWTYLGRQESRYWPYWCWVVARSAVLSAWLMMGACASLPCGPLCACLRLGRSLTSAASSLGRVVVVAKVLRALRETLLVLEARTMALSGRAMACFEAMRGGVVWEGGGGGGGRRYQDYGRRRRPGAVSQVASPMHWSWAYAPHDWLAARVRPRVATARQASRSLQHSSPLQHALMPVGTSLHPLIAFDHHLIFLASPAGVSAF